LALYSLFSRLRSSGEEKAKTPVERFSRQSPK
jgi:hypothetical protein